MRKLWAPTIVVAITMAAGIAAAQTHSPAPGGAFESLSPGNQKIANAIFDAQQPVAPGGSTKPLSLDQIAAMKQGGTTEGGKGWGVVWKDLRSQGLVQGNLGQAVSQSNHVSKSSNSIGTEITTASGRTMTVGGRDRANTTVSGRRFGSDDARGGAETSAAGGQGRDGGGASAARGGAGSHGGGRGK